MNIKDDFILKDINEGYLVGGSVRDFYLGKKILVDRDIAIKRTWIRYFPIFSRNDSIMYSRLL